MIDGLDHRLSSTPLITGRKYTGSGFSLCNSYHDMSIYIVSGENYKSTLLIIYINDLMTG